MTTANRRIAQDASTVERIADEIQRAKHNIARSAAAAGEDLSAELRSLQDDLDAIKLTMAGFAMSSTAEATGAASRIGAVASETASDFADSAKKQTQSVLADLETFARKNPRYVLGGAVGIGLVLGLIMRRR
jgi:ElaB/YqjD/DUF883 family membrane-anchored ribosome-binding protein